MDQENVGQGIGLGAILSGVVLCSIGLMSILSDYSTAHTPPTPDAIIHSQPPAALPTVAKTSDIATPSKAPSANEKIQGELDDLLQAWRKAWAGKDTAAYLALYTADFQGTADTPEQWRANRTRILGQAKFIDIQIGQASTKLMPPDQATLTFTLDYASDRIEDHGIKTLQLRRNNGQWLIEEEIFTAN